jgi:glycosyltransferase involved in cell wall biosynthesis
MSRLKILRRISAILTGGRWRPARSLDRVPRVSVVIPCYNYGRYLRQCVGSVTCSQPNVDLEVIIVDDRSTDDSLEIARSIEKEDSRVRVIAHESNKGHIATYNDGLTAATGEFVLLLSADDLATPGALTRAAELLVAEPSVGLVYGNAIHFAGDPPASRNERKGWIVWSGRDWLRGRCQSGYNVAASPEVVMRTSVLREIGGYRPDLPHAGDFEMWLRTSAVSDIGFLMGVDQAYYRKHAVNMNRRDFASGTDRGQLIDLKQRWECFEVVFSGAGGKLEEGAGLLQIARRTIASQALGCVNYAYARGLRDFPAHEFEALADQIHADVRNTRVGRALDRRKRLGMSSLPVHPLWAPSALGWRLRELVRQRRRQIIGI